MIDKKLDLPILHIPQLIGLAMDIEPEKLGLNRHVVNTKPLLQKAGV